MRTPIASDLMSRDGTLQKDAGTKNAIIEVAGESSAVRRRPGSVSLGAAGSGVGQLLVCYNGELKSIIGNTLADLVVTTMIPSGADGMLGVVPLISGEGLSGVAYGAGKFVGIANPYDNSEVLTSLDGINWTNQGSIDVYSLPSEKFNGVAFGNGVFVTSYGGTVFTSSDGISWIERSDDGIDRVKFVNDTFISRGATGSFSTFSFYTSSNGVSWTLRTATHGFGSGSVLICDVCFFLGRYYFLVEKSGAGKRIVHTADFVSWTSYPVTIPNNSYSLAVAGNRMVHSGAGYSEDGTVWNASSGLNATYLVEHDALSLNGVLVVIAYEPGYGNNQASYRSDDFGSTWTKYKQYYSDDWFGRMAVGDNKIVAVSDSRNKSTLVFSVASEPQDVVNVDSSQAITSIEPSLQFFAEVAGQAQSQNVLFLKNSREAWKYDGTTLSKITDADYPGWSVVTPTSITRSGSTTTVTLPAAVNWQSGSSVTIAGAAQAEYNGTFVINVTDSTHFTYQVTGTPATPATGTITAKGGRTTVPGVVYLDGYFFVMDRNAVIYNCGLGDPTSWNALDFITANIEPGSGVALAKSQNYVIALKSWSTEFFYDAGNATGSPLSPVLSAFTLIGCASGESVANIDGMIAFVSKTRQKGRAVHVMSGQVQEQISTPDIERILNADTMENVYSYGVRISGHVFYVLGLRDSGLTLVYDFTSKTWGQWTSLTARAAKSCTIVSSGGWATATCTAHGLSDGDPVTIAGAGQAEYNGLKQVRVTDANTFLFPVSGAPVSPATGTITATGYDETYFKYTKYVYCSGRDLVLHETTGELCEITDAAGADNTVPINMVCRTNKLDGGSEDRKTMAQLRVIGNKNGGLAMVRWSDDDYTTFSAFRTLDLSSEQARLTRCGSFRRRSFELRHVANAPVQVAALELEINQEK